MDRYNFNKKFSFIQKGKLNCARVQSSTRIQLMVWTGDIDPLGPVRCKVANGQSFFTHIAAINNSILETTIVYSITCLNKVLCIQDTSKFDHVDVLYTIPNYRKGGSPPQPTTNRHTLICGTDVDKPQEILMWGFIEEPNNDSAHLEPVRITVEIMDEK